MTTCDEIQPRLSDLVDGTLEAADRALVDDHVRECEACAGLVRDLVSLRQAARSLGPMAPPAHVWLEVAGQIRQRTPPTAAAAPTRSRLGPAWQWAGLAAALVVITTGTYVFLRLEHQPPVGPPPVAAAGPSGSAEVVADELSQAMAHYQKAIAELEVITKTNNGALDPALAATLQTNLGVIDAAIVDSRAALTHDPSNLPARDSLLEAMQRKVSVLQETVALMNEIRQGDQVGVARVVSGFPKKS
jgi:hypothetical protein